MNMSPIYDAIGVREDDHGLCTNETPFCSFPVGWVFGGQRLLLYKRHTMQQS